MAAERIDGASAARLARAVLPVRDDLPGTGWATDDTDTSGGHDDGDGDALLVDECLPPSFPDDAVVASADVTWMRPEGAGVHALAAVFHTAADAATAWTALASVSFASCFAGSIVEGAAVVDGELLGPVMVAAPTTAPVAPTSSGTDAGVHVARFVRATEAGVDPFGVRVAVLGAGFVVVVLCAVDRGDAAADRRWAELVERAAARVDAASEAYRFGGG